MAAAVTRTSHTLLAANAGTGKTTTVVGKILWHLGLARGVSEDTDEALSACPADKRIELGQLAAITFTEKAAYDLARKLREEIERANPDLLWELDRASIGTIHAFTADLLREHALRFGVDPSFRVLDEREARLEQSALAREVVLAAAAGRDTGTEALLEAYPLDPLGDWGKSSAVNFVLQVMRDLRWHPDRYARWVKGDTIDWPMLGVTRRDAPDRRAPTLPAGEAPAGSGSPGARRR